MVLRFDTEIAGYLFKNNYTINIQCFLVFLQFILFFLLKHAFSFNMY